MAGNSENPRDWREAYEKQQDSMKSMQNQMNNIQQLLERLSMQQQTAVGEDSESDPDFDNRTLPARRNPLLQIKEIYIDGIRALKWTGRRTANSSLSSRSSNQIQDELALCTFYRVDMAYSHALKAENKLKRQTFRQESASVKNTIGTKPIPKNDSQISSRLVQDLKGKEILGAKPAESGIICYKCNKPGHKSSDCPMRKFDSRANLIESHEENENGEETLEQEDADEISEESPDATETNLMIHRILSASKSTQDDWKRRSLFRTICSAGGKFCSLVIDSGSTENFVSREMVDKLKLKTEKLAQTYKIAWFKDGDEFPVTERCLVEFSIGKTYADKVWCDVVPMDVSHLLLGRPWQFDRSTIHDGRENTYIVTKDNKKVRLVP
uniref:CCHC-type domain-containing protein n=1 Tax=Ananas comosus var. bracteatus TaxID=296719 RepID=A0A6V7P4U2_ANACO|nr:unnamed protein product [Ananas comosus var. bracteatus]